MTAPGPLWLGAAARAAAYAAVVPLGAWAALALTYRCRLKAAARVLLILLWLLIWLTTLLLLSGAHARAAVAVFVCVFAAVLAWWLHLKPSNQRDWADDVARTLGGEICGDLAVLHNVRNFQWRTSTDYEVRWETRSYDLQQLVSVDLITSYWDIPGV